MLTAVRHEIITKQAITYNVTLRCGRATIIAVENQYVLRTLIVFVALGIQHAMFMHHIVICDVPRSTIVFHVFS
jgi:hypothetical protein